MISTYNFITLITEDQSMTPLGQYRTSGRKKKSNQLITQLNQKLGLYLSICFGVFLFVLFFQPFAVTDLNYDNKLVFIGGFALIVFLLMFITGIAIPLLFRFSSANPDETLFPSYISSLLLLSLCSVAFAFYLAYVGHVVITFYLMVKVVFICLAPVVVLRVNDVFQETRQQNISLISANRNLQKQIEEETENHHINTISFIAENNNKQLSLPDADIIFIRSADNYAEIVFRDGDRFNKTLIRNTLKNIELQLMPFPFFIRCHRNCIVNIQYIDGLTRNYHNHFLHIHGSDQTIPVSRQYLVKIKEALQL